MTQGAAASIPHLSIPVSDMDAAEGFYSGLLGGTVGRRTAGWVDVWVFGVQLTLNRMPRAVTPSPYREALHFGATVDWDEWPDWLARLEGASAPMATPPHRDADVAKIYVSDPDGYIVEIKAYADAATLARPSP